MDQHLILAGVIGFCTGGSLVALAASRMIRQQTRRWQLASNRADLAYLSSAEEVRPAIHGLFDRRVIDGEFYNAVHAVHPLDRPL